MWFNNKFFKYATGTLVVLLVIFMLGQVDFFIVHFRRLFAVVSTPLMITAIFYYILRPLVRLLERFRLPRSIAIILSYIIVVAIFALIGTYTGSIVASQFYQLLNDLPSNFEIVRQKTNEIMEQPWFNYLAGSDFQKNLLGFLQNTSSKLSLIILGLVGKVTNIGSLVFTVPFILFYFLKDDRRFFYSMLRLLPDKYEEKVKKIVKDVDIALSSYILGQMTVALAIGVMMFIGYMIIRLKYSLILAIFATITCIIPFFGPWIGIIPAVLLSLTYDPFMAVKIFLVMQTVQLIDNNFISPNVMGKRLDIHPVTVILLLTVAVSTFGVAGLIIIIPAYAAIKVTVKNIYEMYTGRTLDFEHDLTFTKASSLKNAIKIGGRKSGKK